MIRKFLAATAIVAMAMSTTSEGRQVATTRGLVIEAIQRGSALDEAGLKPGDELVSWTRSVPPSMVAVAQGEFHSPFDAREFEIEQLPRGGVSVVARRGGTTLTVQLLPGAPGVTVRPVFSDSDLAVYETGRAIEKERPSDALVAWQPLIDRAIAANDAATAAWLITRVASAFAVLDQTERAAELFERAAAMFREPLNSSFEATVWEGKGLALYSEKSTLPDADIDQLHKRPRVEAAIEALERASVLRASNAPQSLAAAQSGLDLSFLGFLAVALGTFPDASLEERRLLERSEAGLDRALTTYSNLAPGSFVLARALFRRAQFDLVDWTGQRTSIRSLPVRLNAGREPLLREAWSILESVAARHSQMRPVANQLTLLLDNLTRNDEGRRPDLEDVAKRQVALAERSGDRDWLETATFRLALALADGGAPWEAVSLAENLLRTGSHYAGLASSFRTLAGVLGGHAIDAEERVDILMLSHVEDDPTSTPEQGRLLSRLTYIARARGDFGTAETLAGRRLALEERAAARPPAAAVTPAQSDASTRRLVSALFDLASAVHKRGDNDRAAALARRAVALQALLKDQSVGTQRAQASGLLVLASLTGDRAAIEIYSDRQLALTPRDGKGSNQELVALNNAALTQIELGNTEKATAFLDELLTLRRRFQPGTHALAETLCLLGRTVEEQEVAFRYFDEALDILDHVRRGLSSDWAESWGGGDPITNGAYVDFVDRLVNSGQLARAFQVLERSRGRALRDMLAARDVRDAFSVPPPLREERRRLEAQYDEAQFKLETPTAVRNMDAIEALREHLRELELQLTGVNARIARIDPRITALQQPKPLSLAEARARLDPGTVLLSYLVGPAFTYVFVVPASSGSGSGDAGVTVHRIEMGEQQLRQSIEAFRTLIGWDAIPAQSDRVALRYRGRELYEALVRPAEAQIGAAERVLVSPDGPLHALPFDALVRDLPTGPQYLVQWKPLHTVISMGVYGEVIRARRAADRVGTLVAFGDPKYPVGAETPGDAEVDFVLRSGAQMTPLPGTRKEVGAIAGLFGSSATTYLGESATEARATSIDRSVRYVHFAVHGLLNERLPMNSALVFTVPASVRSGEPNGLLQAWEIIDKVRIDADLVTLSACDSGLGKEVAGEGLVGLTRAFLFAGARSVAASLWKVADGPTAELMTRFYRNLRDGQTKDEALRNAQMALIKMGRLKGSSIDYSSPAHWAAFTLTGDWR